MNSQEVFAKMKEENKAQEEKLAQKIMEGNENLKKTLQKINIHSNIVFFSLHIQYRYRTPYLTTFFILIPQKYYILLQ